MRTPDNTGHINTIEELIELGKGTKELTNDFIDYRHLSGVLARVIEKLIVEIKE